MPVSRTPSASYRSSPVPERARSQTPSFSQATIPPSVLFSTSDIPHPAPPPYDVHMEVAQPAEATNDHVEQPGDRTVPNSPAPNTNQTPEATLAEEEQIPDLIPLDDLPVHTTLPFSPPAGTNITVASPRMKRFLQYVTAAKICANPLNVQIIQFTIQDGHNHGNAFYAYPMNGNAKSTDTAMADNIATALAEAFNIPKPSVIPIARSPSVQDIRAGPMSFRISGIPAPVTPYVLEHPLIAFNPNLALFFFKNLPAPDQPPFQLIISLQGLSHGPDEEGSMTNKNIITTAVREALLNFLPVRNFFNQNRTHLLPQFQQSPAAAIAHMCNSLDTNTLTLAHKQNQGTYHVWNIFANLPFTNPTCGADLRETLREAHFYVMTSNGSVGIVNDVDFFCYRCKSEEHPTGLCPFPLIPDWVGPSPTDGDGGDNDKPRPSYNNGFGKGRARGGYRGGRGRF